MSTVLRSYGSNQERDEQYKVVLVCNRISGGLAYIVSMCIYQIGTLITTGHFDLVQS